MKPISQMTDNKVASLTTDELQQAIIDEGILQGVPVPTTVYAIDQLNVGYVAKADATKALVGMLQLVFDDVGNISAVPIASGITARLVDSGDMTAYRAIYAAGMKRFNDAVVKVSTSNRLIAKRDAYLAAANGDAILAQKFWAVENPNIPWPV